MKDLIAKRKRREAQRARAERYAREQQVQTENLTTEDYQLPADFSEQVIREIKHLPSTITNEEILRRRDMRDILTFTIDPDDAKDFDDALSFQVLETGNYQIGIHIADVTHYVAEGSAVDEEAYQRGTSVYLVDRVIPMLPRKLKLWELG